MKYILISIFVYLSTNGIAQELSVDWGVCFGADYENSYSRALGVLPNNHIVNSLIVTNNNDAFTDYHGESDAWVIITDSNGTLVFERCFGGGGHDYFGDIEVTDEYIYFVGQTNSTDGDVQSDPIGGYMNLWVVKTDFNLNIIWERQYGCLGTQDFEVAKLTPEGGLILFMDFFNQGGGDVSEYYGATDIWVCEIDANGEILWEKTLGNSSSNLASNVIQTEEGNIVVLGVTYAPGGMIECEGYGDRDIWAVELDNQTQEIIWQNCYGGSNIEEGRIIIEDGDGYLIGGVTRSNDGDVSFNHGEGDAWLIETDYNGQVLWEHCFGGSDGEQIKNIYKTEDGGYFLFCVTGSTDGDVNNTNCPYPFCPTSTWAIELDSDKEMLWNGTHGAYDYSYFEKNGIERVGERDFIIAGVVWKEGINTGDVDCEPYPILNGKSAWIYRLYDTSTGVVNNYQKLKGLKVYPNPANTQITFELSVITKEGRLQIKNIFGEIIVEFPIYKGQEQLIWDCSSVARGVYYYESENKASDSYQDIYRGKIVVSR